MFPEKSSEPKPGDPPGEDCGLLGDDTDHLGSGTGGLPVQDLLLLVRSSASRTLPAPSGASGMESPQDTNFIARHRTYIPEEDSLETLRGEPNVFVSTKLNMIIDDLGNCGNEGSGGSYGDVWPEATDLTLSRLKNEAVSSGVTMTMSHQTFTDSSVQQASSPVAQEDTSDGKSSCSPAATKEHDEPEVQVEQKVIEEQDASNIRICGGFGTSSRFLMFSITIIINILLRSVAGACCQSCACSLHFPSAFFLSSVYFVCLFHGPDETDVFHLHPPQIYLYYSMQGSYWSPSTVILTSRS